MVQNMGLYKLSEFLNFYDLLEFLRDKDIYNVDIDNLTISQEQRLLQLIVVLTHENKLNPVFFYNGLIEMGKYYDSEFGLLSNKPHKTVHFKGYLSVGHYLNSKLSMEEKWDFNGFFKPYRIIPHKLDSEFHNNEFTHFIKESKFDYMQPLSKREYIEFKNILYPIADIEKIINNNTDIKLSYAEKNILDNAELYQKLTIAQQKIIELEQQLEQIRVGKDSQSDTPADENRRTQDPKIIAMMAILLADNQKNYKWGDMPNRSKIETAIQNLIDNRYFIDGKHTHGLDAPSKRIGKCLDEFAEFFYTLPKPNTEK